MESNIVRTYVEVMVMTTAAMETLERNLEQDRRTRANKCRYCCAVPGDPCHTRRGGIIRSGYHIARYEDRKD